MNRKTVDPRKIALEDKAYKARVDFEKWYARMKRALKAMEKARVRLVRLQRQIDRMS
jgi:hypothetical protein